MLPLNPGYFVSSSLPPGASTHKVEMVNEEAVEVEVFAAKVSGTLPKCAYFTFCSSSKMLQGSSWIER